MTMICINVCQLCNLINPKWGMGSEFIKKFVLFVGRTKQLKVVFVGKSLLPQVKDVTVLGVLELELEPKD